ncbi:hypothetical protein KV097_00235 [Mumia sp. zg.B17]|uniref:hypothetical protein n=1 Tax=Mumia sp. zg.B17 TaxID=2855446 RepID=UPI001C6E151E|nr:hypothetical protein [Mumia sp. zg.B17]MBW9204353.1 hypothetical protein [Mumia sp. zg.B17]
MLVLRILAANAAVVAVWIAALSALGFRAIPMEVALLAMGLITSSLLVTRAVMARERRRVPVPGLIEEPARLEP